MTRFTSIDFTRNTDDLAEVLDTIDTRGGTSLWDAIYLSLEHIREGKEDKKALLVISDGEDRDSRYKFETVLEIARESQASIYVVGLFDKEAERSRAQKKVVRNLKDLAEDTGGKHFRNQPMKWKPFAAKSPMSFAINTPLATSRRMRSVTGPGEQFPSI
ncbi:MAG: VWA domain-containing protein [Terriglobia bacterium]